jgi:hypothetical protein
MNDNLTLREQLVELTTDLHPVPGRHLVVFKKVREGLEFRSIVVPGQSFKRFFLESQDSLVAYRVTCDKQLRLRFSNWISTPDRTRGFNLDGTLVYHVRDPRTLIESVERDPLRSVREEAVRILSKGAELLDWSVVEKGLHELQSFLRQEGSQRLRDFSRNLGIEVTGLELQRSWPELSGRLLDPHSIQPLPGGGALPEVLSSAFAHVSLVEPVARYSISLALLHLLGELLTDRARALDSRDALDRIYQAKARELRREPIPAVRATSRDEEIQRLYEKLAALRSLEGSSSNGRMERELNQTFSQLRKLQLEEAAELRSAAEEKLLMPLGAGKELLGRIDRLLLDDEDRSP